jgi:hypothetical protein
MRNLILSALLLASAFHNAFGYNAEGNFTYDIYPDGTAGISGYTGIGQEVWFPSSLGGHRVTYIGGGALQNPYYSNSVFASVTKVVIPNSVTMIGNSAFSGCTGLTSVDIPNSVTLIGGGAFSGCTGLTSVDIPSSVTEILDSAFWYCTGLTSITIPNSVIHIGTDVFRGTSIPSTAIPERFLSQIGQIGLPPQDATNYLVNTLANNNAFRSAIANNNAFVSALANNNAFVSALANNNAFVSALAGNNAFVSALAGNNAFVSAIANNNAFVSALSRILAALRVPTFSYAATINAKNGKAFNVAPIIAGYPAPTFSIITGSLPPGLSLNRTTAAITGTPTTLGTYPFTVRGSNLAGDLDRSIRIVVVK